MGNVHNVTGTWMQDGYQDGRGRLTVVVDASGIYDEEVLYLAGRDEAKLRVDSDGELAGWCAGRTFAPDAGELARIGVGA